MLSKKIKITGVEVNRAEVFNGAISICDVDGIIVSMNQFSIKQFEKDGGEKLLFSNLLDCHPEPSILKLRLHN